MGTMPVTDPSSRLSRGCECEGYDHLACRQARRPKGYRVPTTIPEVLAPAELMCSKCGKSRTESMFGRFILLPTEVAKGGPGMCGNAHWPGKAVAEAPGCSSGYHSAAAIHVYVGDPRVAFTSYHQSQDAR
ncbi:hypothetical protein HAX54_018124 [Datura stramonium]|uniref:Uncharacterized protein n=1 Tax=Datura stramonium TaxID=4076 RepID=A0ABS8UND6_DATST|nr:hypothetical protein [Datura stramonium]